MEEGVAEEREEENDPPVTRPEPWPDGTCERRDRDQDQCGDCTPERGERQRREEGLSRLDCRMAPAPDQGDEEEGRDDASVAGTAVGRSAGAGQRFFMSSGKLEEKEYDFATPWA